MRLASWLTSAKRRKPRRLNEVDFVRHGRLTCSAAVASAADDAEVLAWLRARIDDERVVKWRRQFFGARLADVPTAGRSRVIAYYPVAARLPPETLMIDIIDRDDAEMFTQT